MAAGASNASAPASGVLAPTTTPLPASSVIQSAPLTLPATSTRSVQLPPGCRVVVTTATRETIAVCQPAQESWLDKVIPALPSLVISIVAIVLSLRTQSYTRSKDQGARAQSIQDDFWIRKVVAPISIEPFLKYVNELPSQLPLPALSTDAEVEAYWVQQVDKMAQFTVAFRTLALIDTGLDHAVTEKMGALEDLLATYCGELRQHLSAAAAPPDRGVAVLEATAISLGIMKLIQAHQVAVGSTS